MTVKVEETALMVYLKSKSTLYSGKISELRNAVQPWLEFVPQSFRHYTRHTIEHSEEIISQLSKLLFKDDDASKPVVILSATETYILLVSAYLHDVGMVVSDSEKLEILASYEWKKWTEENGGGHKRWVQIQAFRNSSMPPNAVLRNFLADVQTRFLIAEFIRHQHHLRSAKIITVHEHALGGFALKDPILLRTIRNCCISHGLTQPELEDRQMYPDRCDIQGEKVNVRFLAILLRIGDLLDMSHNRACPLLLSAASPLPPESLAHWSKYQKITHRMTAPDKVEVRAECDTQDEHRFLQDWCQWLVQELREAGVAMSRATRHNNWVPPNASIEGPDRTIDIRPAPDAKYIPSRWTFNLDEKAVFQRLITDIYKDPMGFVRELVQNALDATRCQMYIDLEEKGLELPEYPTRVEESRRSRYPIEITLGTTQILNELSGETETRQVLTIDDQGIGMDKDVILRFFLQVGQSYYKTEDFRRRFKFIPSSQFGIGFLSVFAVSNDITVETYNPRSRSGEGPIRLRLRGPRNYVLTEQGERQSCGTRIKIVLLKPTKNGELTKRLRRWCKRVEFPIVINELGHKQTILAEQAEQFRYDLPDLSEDGARFVLRTFPLDRMGVEGELHIFTRVDSKGESWNMKRWAETGYESTHPMAFTPPLPETLICRNGIAMEGYRDLFGGWRTNIGKMGMDAGYRIDIRCKLLKEVDARNIVGKAVSSKVEEILKEHLTTEPRAKLPDSWSYKQSLIEYFPVISFWNSYPGTIRIYVKGKTKLTSLKELLLQHTITTILDLTNTHYLVHSYFYSGKLDVKSPPIFDNKLPTLTDEDVYTISWQHRHSIFVNRKPENVRWIASNHLAIDWRISSTVKYDHLTIPAISSYYTNVPTYLVELTDSNTIGIYIHETVTSQEAILLNHNHPFIRWFKQLRDLEIEAPHLEKREFTRLSEHIYQSIKYHHNSAFLERLQYLYDLLKTSEKLPKELHSIAPTNLRFTREMFLLEIPKGTS